MVFNAFKYGISPEPSTKFPENQIRTPKQILQKVPIVFSQIIGNTR